MSSIKATIDRYQQIRSIEKFTFLLKEFELAKPGSGESSFVLVRAMK